MICSSSISGVLRHRAEQRVERLARLEVDRAVLDLDDDVVAELCRRAARTPCTPAWRGLGRRLAPVDERAPDDDAAVRRQRVGQHVGAVGMGAAVVLRPGLAFGVGLDQEAAEVGDEVGRSRRAFARHQAATVGIERVGGREPAELHGRAEARREIDADAAGPEDVGERRRPFPGRRRQDLRVGVDVVEHGAVDADRGVGARVVA